MVWYVCLVPLESAVIIVVSDMAMQNKIRIILMFGFLLPFNLQISFLLSSAAISRRQLLLFFQPFRKPLVLNLLFEQSNYSLTVVLRI